MLNTYSTWNRKNTTFSSHHYHCNHSALDIGMFSCINVHKCKEHANAMCQIPPETPCRWWPFSGLCYAPVIWTPVSCVSDLAFTSSTTGLITKSWIAWDNETYQKWCYETTGLPIGLVILNPLASNVRYACHASWCSECHRQIVHIIRNTHARSHNLVTYVNTAHCPKQ
jgi:hypothetical protein